MRIKALIEEMKEVKKEDKEKINKIKEELAFFGWETLPIFLKTRIMH